MDDPTRLPDLLALRGTVLAASDEFFAAKENLIKAAAPVFTPATFGAKGQVYDGWETRRMRAPDGTLPPPDASDWVIARLGAPGIVHAVVVDTAFFTGNYPQACSVEACGMPGYPTAAELGGAAWHEIVPRGPLSGGTEHTFGVRFDRRCTHVRLNIFPDGGVARLRVHGEVVPDPALLRDMTVDLASAENGADVVACSDEYFSAPRNVISPGLARVMGEGWETRRRRTAGHEWLVVRLAGQGTIQLAEIDTSGYRGNAPAFASLQAIQPATDRTGAATDQEGFELLSKTRLLPDTVHRFRLDSGPVTHVRLNIFPDGGVARLRLYGTLTPDGVATIDRRWHQTVPVPVGHEPVS